MLARSLHIASAVGMTAIFIWYSARNRGTVMLAAYLGIASVVLWTLVVRSPNRLSLVALVWFSTIFGLLGYVSPSAFGIATISWVILAVAAAVATANWILDHTSKDAPIGRDIGLGIAGGLLCVVALLAVVG